MAKDYQHEDAFDTGFLAVGKIHKVYYEQYGKQDGKPVIFLHGGPGGQTAKWNTAFFDPLVYRVVLLDQRGAGKSEPHAEIKENTTQFLGEDIESLRKHLQIRKWHMVFGGSWGSSLALYYAEKYPESVGSLVLRGVFTLRKDELNAVFRKDTGAAMQYPAEYDKWISYLSPEDRATPVQSYHRLLTCGDQKIMREAAQEWNRWETSTSKLQVPPEDFDQLEDDRWSRSHAMMETWYFINGGFIEEGQLLKKENVDRIRHIPCTIVQGRLDLVCPPRTAYDLHQAWPESSLHMIPAAGHNVKEPGIYAKLIEICNEYGQRDFA